MVLPQGPAEPDAWTKQYGWETIVEEVASTSKWSELEILTIDMGCDASSQLDVNTDLGMT
jgi:hypothetical protein